LEGLGKIGYCAGTARWFCGVREHLIFTPHGMVTSVTQVPGNRHDVQGLYTLLRTTFHGLLFSDNAYTPGAKLDAQLRAREIVVIAQPRKNSRQPLPRRTRIFVHAKRSHVERRISLFDKQFNAGRTLCRSARYHCTRRWFKALAHNLSRYINPKLRYAAERMLHYRSAA